MSGKFAHIPVHQSKLSIERVDDLTTGTTLYYTPGGVFRIRGRGFGDMDEVPDNIGVYVNNEHRSGLHRVRRYFSWRDDEIEGEWPFPLFGRQRVFVEIAVRGNLIISALYGKPLLPRGTPLPQL